MDGLLVVDKPAGLTSHEVVTCVRRAFGERRVGHTGTLDPAATGVLALVLGRATRLARFLSGNDKAYEATLHLGWATDSYDADGAPVGPRFAGAMPGRAAIGEALEAFRGTFLQRPPAFSAKKIDGMRSYRMARRARRERAAGAAAAPALPPPVLVSAHAIDLVSVDGPDVTLHVECSAGFYVRSLVHDLGRRLGTGAHLTALRRTRSGALTLAAAATVETLLRSPDEARRSVIPLAGMLPELPAVTLTSEGLAHAVHGRQLGPRDLAGLKGQGIHAGGAHAGRRPNAVRLLDAAGDLVGIATPASVPGFLHPSVVLK